MKLPKAVCVIGAPIVTFAEIGVILVVTSYVAYGLFDLDGGGPLWVGALGLALMVAGFLMTLRDNYRRCRGFWREQ